MEKIKKEHSKTAHETKKMITAGEMLCPLLEFIKDEKVYHINDAEQPLAERFSLSEKEMTETIPSGQKRFLYRLGWAKWYLTKAELITKIDNSKFKINQSGLTFLNENPNFILKTFEKIPAYIKNTKKSEQSKSDPQETNHEIEIKNALLENIKDVSPYFFEEMMSTLLGKMGYGLPKTTKKSHDGGIDVIVTADKLGLNEIYVEVKRYSYPVPIAHIRSFIGVIQQTRTKMGVFITSSTFPTDAHDSVLKSGLNIKLIDGKMLSDLMYEFDIGLTVKKSKPIKDIDDAFFIRP